MQLEPGRVEVETAGGGETGLVLLLGETEVVAGPLGPTGVVAGPVGPTGVVLEALGPTGMVEVKVEMVEVMVDTKGEQGIVV